MSERQARRRRDDDEPVDRRDNFAHDDIDDRYAHRFDLDDVHLDDIHQHDIHQHDRPGHDRPGHDRNA